MKPRVSYLIKRVERGVRAGLDAALRSLGMTTNEYTTLSVLESRSGLSSAQLARRAFVSAQAMNLIVVSLERSGWIVRTPDPDHGRILRAALTPAGLEMLAACDRATDEVQRTLVSGLTAHEADALRVMLETCAATLSESALGNHDLSPAED